MKINEDLIIGNTSTSLVDLYTQTNNLKGKILWTNSKSTSSFSSQTIALNSDDYDMYEIMFFDSTSSKKVYTTGKIIKGYGTHLSLPSAWGGTTMCIDYRIVDATSSTKLSIDSVYNYSQSGSTTSYSRDNSLLVPLYVIGYKTGLF